ncbi:MAG: PBECR2 nuclease fold domain-containing protein [Eubacteriales bacterium]|nr:PBECR2 nuclease fold domain-containing protein [Eubacteriales bacterium]
MLKVADIDISMYACVSPCIRSSTVILTENQIEHIIKRRGQDFFEKYSPFFREIAEDPDYIFPDKKHPDTAIACKTLNFDGTNVHLVIRLAVEGDDPALENSIITALVESDRRYAQRLRNNVPLYKRE